MTTVRQPRPDEIVAAIASSRSSSSRPPRTRFASSSSGRSRASAEDSVPFSPRRTAGVPVPFVPNMCDRAVRGVGERRSPPLGRQAQYLWRPPPPYRSKGGVGGRLRFMRDSEHDVAAAVRRKRVLEPVEQAARAVAEGWGHREPERREPLEPQPDAHDQPLELVEREAPL